MVSKDFNLSGEALRKLLVVAVDVSEGKGDPEWEVQGYKTEESSIEFNQDTTTLTDILGDTYTDVNKFEEQQSFEPNTLRSGTKLNSLLLNYWRTDQLQKFSQFPVMIAYGFLGDDPEDGPFEADIFQESTIAPESLGGSSRVDMPFTIYFGGSKAHGTVDKLKTGMKFTPEA